MPDSLLSTADRQEALSRAYVSAIAASAGYVTSSPDLDRDSVDITISAGGSMRPSLAVQLKATVNLKQAGSDFKFVLSTKNYDDLRRPTQAPRILVVLSLPRTEATWLNVSIRRLILRRCAYWVSLRGKPDLPDEQQSVTVIIPSTNVFDVQALRQLMIMARTGTVT